MHNKQINWGKLLRDNAVTIMFIVICAVCMACSGLTGSYVMYELVNRLARNSFLVLALIIPIIAGMGINFAVTIGAMGAQIALVAVLEWRIPGIQGFLVAALLTIPIAGFFGLLIGKLLNKMKGQEMIGSMILGFFANGLYQLLFLFGFGTLIPIANDDLIIKGSTGIANTMDLSKKGGLKYALDGIWQLNFQQAMFVFATILAVVGLFCYLTKRMQKRNCVAMVCAGVGISILALLPPVEALFAMVRIPMVTVGVVLLLCLLNVVLMRTRLGQQFRAVGPSGGVANAAGINVDRVRVIAIIISTILAGIGQLIFVQNMGSLQTYGAHEQVGLYAGAAILVGGASIVRATNAQ
ncbi:MAG: ABC transporter permease, partial [Clostridia bacterium]